MRWTHIDFWFENYQGELTQENRKLFEGLLGDIINILKPFIRRKFFLYEPVPHCFLAIEVRVSIFIPIIKFIIKRINKPSFVSYIKVNLKAGNDVGNGNGILNIWNAFTDFYLFHRDNKISHVIHCCIEPILGTRKGECDFYQKMAILYQEYEDIEGKRKFFYKDVTPKLKEKLIKYQQSLDLRNIQ